MDASRLGADAIAYASRLGTYEPNLCLRMVRECFGIPALYPDATAGWRNTNHKHTDASPPSAVPVWWTGGADGHGHVALSAGGGYVWSIDQPQTGTVGKVTIPSIHSRWPNVTYAGWSEDVNEVKVYRVYEGFDAAHGAAPINFAAAKTAGKRFAILKGSEGGSFQDPKIDELAPAARGAGLHLGLYHYAHPGSTYTAEQQADFAWLVLRPHLEPGVSRRIGLDIETVCWDGTGTKPGYAARDCNHPAQTWAQVRAWMDRFNLRWKALSGQWPVTYSYLAFFRDVLGGAGNYLDTGVWVADVTGDLSVPGAVIWQYTNDSAVPWAAGAIDHDRFADDADAYSAFFNVTAKPEPPREAEMGTYIIPVADTPGATGVRIAWNPATGARRLGSFEKQLADDDPETKWYAQIPVAEGQPPRGKEITAAQAAELLAAGGPEEEIEAAKDTILAALTGSIGPMADEIARQVAAEFEQLPGNDSATVEAAVRKVLESLQVSFPSP
jgi:GH25 family lysozyme M1 (1,4-beta-N-acetylmuramidase)